MDKDLFKPMTPPNNFVKELRGVLDQQNILSAKTKQKGNIKIENSFNNILLLYNKYILQFLKIWINIYLMITRNVLQN